MLLTNVSVKIKWNGNNKKHFVSKGYVFTKLHEEFDVFPTDLPEGSNIYISCECDNCHKIFQTRYNQYLLRKTDETYCRDCSNSVIRSRNQIIKFANEQISFYDWCIQNNRNDLLDRWDYNLNIFNPQEVYCGSQKKYWFKCDKNPKHKSEQFKLHALCGFDKSKNASSCRQCNSFAQWCLDNDCQEYLEVWRYDLNNIDPTEISFGSHIECGFYCNKCDDIFQTTPNIITTHGLFCPVCNTSKSKGEIVISNILDKNFIQYQSQKTFDNLIGIGGGNLSYDFCLPDYNMLIEFQGKQHEEPIDYFGGKEQFECQQEHDRRKRKYAVDHNIKLLEIWYYDFDNIEQIIMEELGLNTNPIKMLPKYRTLN